MAKKAILFGSIGTIVETSELQRMSFNQAFKEADLDWNWQPDEYRQLLKKSGGRQRIQDYAKARDEELDAVTIHRRKTEIFDAMMIERGLRLRKGVADLIKHAKAHGAKLAFVTTTSRDNVDAIFEALGDQLSAEVFDFIGDASMVSSGKPDPAIYTTAVESLKLDADECVAIEDTPVSAQAATSAGLKTVVFPGDYADRDGLPETVSLRDDLTYQDLMGVD